METYHNSHRTERNRAEHDKCTAFTEGLHNAADLLMSWCGELPVPNTAQMTIDYCVINDDREAARDEFYALRSVMVNEVADDEVMFSERRQKYEGTMQHAAQITFGQSRVTYRVLWIDRIPGYDAGAGIDTEMGL